METIESHKSTNKFDKLGIVGVTGSVGLELLKLTNKITKPISLRIFASKKSVGKKLDGFIIEELTEDVFKDLDYAFFCVEADISKKYIQVYIIVNKLR